MMNRRNSLPQSVLITGASSGIGEALARDYAAAGTPYLFLCGRDAGRLEAVAQACREAGAAHVHAAVIDVADAAATKDWIEACHRQAPLELVFANAGVSTGLETSDHARRTFAINVGGTVNTVLPLLDLWERERATQTNENVLPPLRQVVLTASIAGYAPLAACPSYSASKACLKTWGLSLRARLRAQNIRVNVLCPGFVRSRITDQNTCPMPFFMEAPVAARLIRTRVAQNRGLIAFPWPLRLSVWFLSVLPWFLTELISSHLPTKTKKRKNG